MRVWIRFFWEKKGWKEGGEEVGQPVKKKTFVSSHLMTIWKERQKFCVTRDNAMKRQQNETNTQSHERRECGSEGMTDTCT